MLGPRCTGLEPASTQEMGIRSSVWCTAVSERQLWYKVWLPSFRGFYISRPSTTDLKEISRLLSRTPAVRNACDLDLLLFLRRHPRTLLTSEQLAAFAGYDIQEIAKSLEAFIEAGLLERTQNPMHAARMYLLVTDGPENGGIRDLLELASTRNGRHSILQILDPEGSQPETETTQRGLRLVKIA